ncbi:MAG: hypothetical protein A2W93_10145 [Bacteroidetes bacterium GWF2_43_63]|nr:MAG: hypothetical protein A2W94_02325 [Bacteroidetes bacterium GWE2_42_42]OFY52884.1 MAG: hypothetical protein A2W93_10145 [Bacteroidetes bacterium GWF2_43_63]HBG70089.1 hypothetical protein [Bacteroidales bacterium]HCB62304.1 hypothetical protein [Bacteroidales bacterium]
METQVSENVEIKRKIYREKSIWVGTMLGSPLVGGYMMASNFRAFNEKSKVGQTWIISVLITVVALYLASLIPDSFSRLANFLVPSINAGIAAVIANKLQGDRIAEHIRQGGKIFSGWRVFLITVIAVAAILTVIFGFLFLVVGSQEMSCNYYGPVQNELCYNESEVSQAEVDRMSHYLYSTGVFTDDQMMSVLMEKSGDTYSISMMFNDGVEKDPDFVMMVEYLRQDLEKGMQSPVFVNICAPDDVSDVRMCVDGK